MNGELDRLLARLRSPNFCLPLFGPGPFTNLGAGDDRAWTNASAHAGWALAIPLLGLTAFGRTGLLVAAGLWLAWTFVNESLFHAPPDPGPGYASEVRTDLLSRCLPTLAAALWVLS